MNLVERAEAWGRDRGLIGPGARPQRQMFKVMEEVGEASGALVRWLAGKAVDEDVVDGLGDSLVTLHLLAAQGPFPEQLSPVDHALLRVVSALGRVADVALEPGVGARSVAIAVAVERVRSLALVAGRDPDACLRSALDVVEGRRTVLLNGVAVKEAEC